MWAPRELRMAIAEPPPGVKVAVRERYTRCGKTNCRTCRPPGKGHGPYIYATWREDDGTIRSRILKTMPPASNGDRAGRPQGAEHPDVPAHAPTPVLPLRVQALGGFVVWRGDQPIPSQRWTAHRQSATLFKYLLSAPDYRRHRMAAVQVLWPGSLADDGKLSTVLHRLLRRVLEAPPAASDYVRFEGELVVLAATGGTEPPTDWFDAEAFARAGAAALAGGDCGASRQALALYRGEYLSEEDAPWAVQRRQELQALQLDLLKQLADLYGKQGDYQEAARWFQQALRLDPCNEDLARGLMRLLAKAGRPEEIDRVSTRLLEALALSGRTPSRNILAHTTSLRAEAAMPPVSRSNLREPLSSFVGRTREVAQVQELLASTRLLTLTGVGGCGKTRLALQVAGLLREAYADGVWVIELATCSDPVAVTRIVAGGLGVREVLGSTLGETITDYLRSKQLLLVLDNCEHLRNACASLLAVLLAACPGLHVLATSRERLGLTASGVETAWQVPLLSVPDLAPAGTGGQDSAVPAVGASDAGQLFLARARASDPAFALTTQNAGAVARICRRLDGIPLAIELSAAQVSAMPAALIAARLDDCFRVLVDGPRTALPRHQTMRAALDWSHDLLREQEQILLRRLSFFAGGWTVQAAEAVCPGDGITAAEVPGLLVAVVNKSLVQFDGTAARYRLLEPVRQYERSRLTAPDGAGAIRDRHLHWCAELAEQATPALQGPEPDAWLARLEAEHDNLRAALRWAMDSGNGTAALRLAGALWRFWHVRGHLSEGLGWLEEALAQQPSNGVIPTAVRIKAVTGAGVLAAERGDYERAASLLEHRLALAQELGDGRAIAAALNGLGNVAFYQTNYAEATAFLRRSWVLRRTLGDKQAIAAVLTNLGEVARYQRRSKRAALLFGASLALFRDVGDQVGIARALLSQGHLALDQRDLVSARTLYSESGMLFRKMGDRWGTAECLVGSAGLACALRQTERGAQLYAAAAALRDAIGYSLPSVDREAFERAVAAVRAELGDASFQVAWEAGWALDLVQAGEEAYGE
jgi:predicted ATPase/DNA-binding SARP family transcriptional activator